MGKKKKRRKRLKTAFVKYQYLLRDRQRGGLVWDPSPKGNVDSVESRKC